MDIRHDYPEYASIEDQIRRAKLERSIAIAHFFADTVHAIARSFYNLAAGLSGFARAKSDPPLPLPREAAHR